MNTLLSLVSARLRRFTLRIGGVVLGILLVVLYAQSSWAQNAAEANAPSVYSTATILTLAATAVISVLYLRGMYLVLTYASQTYSYDDDDDHYEGNSAQSNWWLIGGAASLVVLSALIITSYGWGWVFLYSGPILCLLGPLVVIFAMEADLKRYRQTLTAPPLQRITETDPDLFVPR
jgi:hypothetical protein